MNEKGRTHTSVHAKTRLRLSKYDVPYTIHESEHTNTYRDTG